jgi:transcriptional regulator with GAF, ATPase, and Fis domain
MTMRRHRAVTWAIWGLVIVFAVIDGVFWFTGSVRLGPRGVAQVVMGWALVTALALIATRRLEDLATDLIETRHAHRATKTEVEQLQMHIAMLEIFTRSVDVPLAFGSVAQRIARLVPCDRVGLALLTEEGDEFQTYTARINEKDGRSRPRPEVVFKVEGTAIGSAVKSRVPLMLNDTSAAALEFLDVNVAHAHGFASVLVIPLVWKGRAVGTLNVVSRRPGAFAQEHVETLLPVTEIFAMAHVAQQLQAALTKHRTMESITELTLKISTEMNSALQTIIGHCGLIERGYPDANLHRDLATIIRQAQRISALLTKMRSASDERLNEAAATVRQGAAIVSPDDQVTQ